MKPLDLTEPGLSRKPQSQARNKVTPASGIQALTLKANGANIQEWWDASDNVLGSVASNGTLTVPNLTLTGFSGVLKAAAGVVAGSATTSDLPEGSNLYYTDARVYAAISGTADRITETSGVIDIAATYVGQASITTLGTIGTGTWDATVIADGKIAAALTGKTYNALTLTAAAVGFTIAGGTTSKTLTVPLDATVSGTNTGDQTITLTGDVTGSGTGSFATTIGANKVSLGMMATLAANSIIGNNTAGAATPIALTAAQTKTLLSLNNVENTALSTWGGSTSITTLGTIATGVWQGSVIDAAYLPAGSAGNANPTASVGLVAVNGSAATSMRSDAAPPLDQGIAPTWTGVHLFSLPDNTAIAWEALQGSDVYIKIRTSNASESIVFGNAVTNPLFTFLGTGLTTFAGAVTVTGALTGTLTGSISGNAATVTTNANLTGPITSVGNATSIASQTGTGTKFVMDTSPSISDYLGIGVAASSSHDLLIEKTVSGGRVGIAILNDSNTASSIARIALVTAGASAGDSFVVFQNNVNKWAIGLDNDSSDAFKISNEVTLGTNDYLTISLAGLVTVPGTLAVTGASAFTGNINQGGATNATGFGINSAGGHVATTSGVYSYGVGDPATSAASGTTEAIRMIHFGTEYRIQGTKTGAGVYRDMVLHNNNAAQLTCLAAGGVTIANALVASSTLQVSGLIGFGFAPTAGSQVIIRSSSLATATSYGIDCAPTFQVGVTTGNAGYFEVRTQASGSLTLTTGTAIKIGAPTVGGGSTITNLYALDIADQTMGSTINAAIRTGLGQVLFGDAVTCNSNLSVTGTATFSSTVITVLSSTTRAGLRIPHGAAPSSPTNGDMWTTTAGLFVRINGVTKTVTLT